jgi:hypothetical protein
MLVIGGTGLGDVKIQDVTPSLIEFPREHDVSEVLMSVPWEKIGSPTWFVDQVGRWRESCKK